MSEKKLIKTCMILVSFSYPCAIILQMDRHNTFEIRKYIQPLVQAITLQMDRQNNKPPSVVEISLQLRAKAPTLDQPDLRVEFMVQGKFSTLTIKLITIIYFLDFMISI